MTFYPIIPVPAPTQTQADRWKKRPCVVRYRDYKDKIRDLKIALHFPCKVIFHMQPAKSWAKKKRNLYIGKPHEQKPDVDNLLKGLLDALYQDDAHCWSIWAEKKWSHKSGIEIIYPITRTS